MADNTAAPNGANRITRYVEDPWTALDACGDRLGLPLVDVENGEAPDGREWLTLLFELDPQQILALTAYRRSRRDDKVG